MNKNSQRKTNSNYSSGGNTSQRKSKYTQNNNTRSTRSLSSSFSRSVSSIRNLFSSSKKQTGSGTHNISRTSQNNTSDSEDISIIPRSNFQNTDSIQSVSPKVQNEYIHTEMNQWIDFINQMQNDIANVNTEVGGQIAIGSAGEFVWSYVGKFTTGGVSRNWYTDFLRQVPNQFVQTGQVAQVVQFHTHAIASLRAGGYNSKAYAPPSLPDTGQVSVGTPPGAKISNVLLEQHGAWYWNSIPFSGRQPFDPTQTRSDLSLYEQTRSQTAFNQLFGLNPQVGQSVSESTGQIANYINGLSDAETRNLYKSTQSVATDYLTNTNSVSAMRDRLWNYALLEDPYLRTSPILSSEYSNTLFDVLSKINSMSSSITLYTDGYKNLNTAELNDLKTLLSSWRMTKNPGNTTPDDFNALYKAYNNLGIQVRYVAYNNLRVEPPGAGPSYTK